MKPARHDLRSVGAAFHVAGDFLAAEPYGSGHINDTYAARYDQGGVEVRYIHQRINHAIFTDPPGLMENIRRVTAHQRRKLEAAGAKEISRRALTLVPSRDGGHWHRDGDGNFWRTYVFIERARTYDQIENTRQAYEAAKAFGAFQAQLADLPGGRLAETIPDFHNTRKRFDVLQAAVAADPHNRAAGVADLIAFANAGETMVDALIRLQQAGRIPERITHNDTKLNNVMIDGATTEGICVIDLDTVMPGLSLYDFGDMVRTATRPTVEDERDLAKVVSRLDMFEALARGFLASAGAMLNVDEKANLAFSGRLISFEIGLRFLTDYLQGDVYFKTHRPGQNVDRCRVQFKMVQSIAEQEDAMNACVQALMRG